MVSRPKRIVSLIASATEIVCALGYERLLVGRSHECDYPETVLKLPRCTAPKFVTDGTSYDIDQRVKAILQEGLSVYRVDAACLDRLQPDIIITQTQCDVCAVSLRDVEEAVCAMIGSRPEIVSLEPNNLADIWNDISRVARAIGPDNSGMELIARLKGRMLAISEMASNLSHRPTVACIEWIDPLMAAGNWVPELVEMAGGINLFGHSGKHSPYLSWQQMCEKDPDIILVLPCGFDIERTRSEMTPLTSRDEWRDLQAVKFHQVFLLDGSQYFNRPGPRVVDSLEILTEIFHPTRFNADHEDIGWQEL